MRRIRWVVAFFCLGASLGAAEPPPSGSVEEVRSTLARWIEAQQIISKEQRDWKQGKEILESRIGQVRSDVEANRQRIAELESQGREVESKRAEVLAETAAVERSMEGLNREAAGFEQRVRALRPRLPDPLQQKLAPLFDRMPADPTRTKISLAERLQNVVGILNEVGKYNGEITLATEVRTLSDGKPTEVRTVYVGLAQAFCVSPGGKAAVGRPGPDGWVWEPADELGPQVAEVVEILQNKAKPKFIPVRVRVS